MRTEATLRDGDQRSLPEHVTTPLLTLITQGSLDVDYQHVADRRSAGQLAGATGRLRPATAVTVSLFGLLLVIAAVQTSRNVSIDEQSRASLITQINTKKSVLADQEATADTLRSRIQRQQSDLDALDRVAGGVDAELLRLEVRTGFVAVHGEGLRITLDDGPGGQQGVVRDSDLAQLADGLWSAGAEAVSINGQRLTALSAIRISGSAINVNDRPISPPYTILAIGDTSTLQSRFAETTNGLAFYSLATTLGFDFQMHNEDDVSLPAARMPNLRWAHRVELNPLPHNEGTTQ